MLRAHRADMPDHSIGCYTEVSSTMIGSGPGQALSFSDAQIRACVFLSDLIN